MASLAYVDVLVLAAMQEERWVLNKMMPPLFLLASPALAEPEKVLIEWASVAPVESPTEVHIYSLYFRGLPYRVAVADLAGMGNLWALDHTVQLLDCLAPLFVLLVGMAAGKQSRHSRGSIAYANATVQGTHGKIVSKSLSSVIDTAIGDAKTQDEQRKLQEAGLRIAAALEDFRLTPNGLDQNTMEIKETPLLRTAEFFGTTAASLAALPSHSGDQSTWRTNAKEGFDSLKTEFEQANFEHLGQVDASMGPQQWCEDPTIPVKKALFASVDQVVASPFIVETLSNHPWLSGAKTKLYPTVFEMESYGVGLSCKSRNIQFAAVKGICDNAGLDKSDLKAKDAYHLASLCSAAAFSTAVITHEGFIGEVRDQRRSAWGRTACISGGVANPTRCYDALRVTDGESLFKRTRPCSGSPATHWKELFGARVFDAVASNDYSESLTEIVEHKQFERIVYIFPYTVDDLCVFLRNSDHTRRQAVRLVEALRNREKLPPGSGLAGAEIAEVAFELGRLAFRQHRHFEASNEWCLRQAKAGDSAAQIAKKMCRVMCIRGATLEEVRADPASILFAAMCGVGVPTFWAAPDIFDDFGRDEATFVTSTETGCSSRSYWKYWDGSRMLSIIGSCNIAEGYGNTPYHGLHLERKVSSFLETLDEDPHSWSRRGFDRFYHSNMFQPLTREQRNELIGRAGLNAPEFLQILAALGQGLNGGS